MAADTVMERGHPAHARLAGVEALRAYAASAIVIFHVIYLTNAAVPESLAFMKWWFGFGVPLFFVVSAFSLTYGYEGRLQTWRQIRTFYTRRVFRIAPLYYFVLAVTLAESGLLAPPSGHDLPLASSLLFTFNLFPDAVDGIVPASWSIGVEMLFYAILPALFPLVRTVTAAALFTVAAIAAAIAYSAALVARPEIPPAFIQHGFLFNLPYFGFGLLAAKLYPGAPPRLGPWLVAVGALLLVGLDALAQAQVPFFVERTGAIVFQAIWGAPFALICLGVALKPMWLISNPASLLVGRISFSVYLAHPHVIGFLARHHVYETIAQLPGGSGVRFPAAVAVTFAVVVPLAWILYKLVEEPGMSLGRILSKPPRAVVQPTPA